MFGPLRKPLMIFNLSKQGRASWKARKAKKTAMRKMRAHEALADPYTHGGMPVNAAPVSVGPELGGRVL